MAGWTCSDKETIEWDGTIRVRKNLIIGGRIVFPDGTTQLTAAGSSQWVANGNDISNTNSGNVGIGTTAPASLLHVRNTADGEIFRFRREGATNNPGLFLSLTEATDLVSLAATGATGQEDFAFLTGASERMRIKGTTGNVGIGTTSPNTKLSLVATSAISWEYGANAASRPWFIKNDVTAYGDFVIATSTNKDYTQDLVRFTINPSGNVGIGTTSPAQSLHVAGAIAYNNMVEPALGLCSGALFVSGGAIYYKGGLGTITQIANA